MCGGELIQTQLLRNSAWLWGALLLLIACAGGEKPTVTIETNKGTVVIELYPDAAPKTVQNFARLVEQGFYDGLTFHRYVPGFVIQGGDPKGDGSGGPGWTVPGEFQDVQLLSKMPKHEKGVVAMARTGNPDSAGSQFYICLDAQPYLDGKYTTFGRVIEGLDVVDQLRQGDQMSAAVLKNYTPPEQ